MSCYICCDTLPDEASTSSAGNEEDDVENLIFFLRIVLDVSSDNFPSDKLSSSLVKSKEWWKLCEECTCLLAIAKLNYSQVVSAWEEFLQSQQIVLKSLKSSSRPNVGDSPFEEWIKLVNNDMRTRPKYNFPAIESLLPTAAIKEETYDYPSDADEDTTFVDDDENNDSETDPVIPDQKSGRGTLRRTRPNVGDSPLKRIRLANYDDVKTETLNFPALERLIPTPIKEEPEDYPKDADKDEISGDHDDINDRDYAVERLTPSLTVKEEAKEYQPSDVNEGTTFGNDDEINDSETDPVTRDQKSGRRSLIEIPYNPAFKALFQNPTTRLYTCPLCDVTNTQKFNLYVHYKTVHLNEPVLSCSWANCDRTFSTKANYIVHMDRHKGQPRYQCDECSLSFYTGKQRQIHHEREHQQGTLKLQFTCSICNKGFMDSFCLYQHERLGHRNGKACPPKKSSGPLNDRPHRKSPEYIKLAHIKRVSGLFHCPSCDFGAVRKDYLLAHYRKKHLEVSYNCTWPSCGKVFRSETLLKSHEDRHKGTPRWKCDMCDKSFYGEDSIRKHQVKMHALQYSSPKLAKKSNWPSQAKVICELCGKSMRKVNLPHHMTNVHAEGKGSDDVVCDICGKVVKKRCLSLHKKNTHEKGIWKDEVCPECGETVRNGYLKQHTRIKHEKEKHLKCTECPLMFPFQNELNVHLHRKHGIVKDLFRCDVTMCRKFCRTEQDLRKHVEDIHGLDKMKPGKFKCDFCERTFFVMSQLRKHVKVQHSKA